MNNTIFNIICVSPVPWDYPIWTNRQHIISILSKKHRIIYVFHPYLVRSVIKRKIKKNKRLLIEKYNQNLWIYTPFIFPFSNISQGIQKINVIISCFFLKKMLKKLRFDKYVLWFYDPEGVFYLDLLSPFMSCYDCVDDYSKMPSYKSDKKKNRLIRMENELVRRCNFVFTTSEILYRKKIKFNNNTFLVENVGDFQHFNKALKKLSKLPVELEKLPKPIIGFVGALDSYKVDYDLIKFIAGEKPEWSIVLIGDNMGSHNVANLKNYGNIILLGRKEYKLLPEYTVHFDVCIIPYVLNEYTKCVFPIKLFEFLSVGKPVVSTALPSIIKYNNIISIAKSYEQFVELIEKSLNENSEEKMNDRITLSKNNTWESRATKLLSHIQNAVRGN
jgi:glycosyltransferase involved in cell wall biosynthesis